MALAQTVYEKHDPVPHTGKDALRILILTTGPDSQSLAARLGRQQDITVDVSPNATTAVALGAIFDVIVLDLPLADVRIGELCRRIRAEKIDVPILVLAPQGATEDIVGALQAGASDFMVKPAAAQAVMTQIYMLRRRSLARTRVAV